MTSIWLLDRGPNNPVEYYEDHSTNKGYRVEQRSVIKFLATEKYKLSEIYRRMCNVYGEVCFSKKKCLQMD